MDPAPSSPFKSSAIKRRRRKPKQLPSVQVEPPPLDATSGSSFRATSEPHPAEEHGIKELPSPATIPLVPATASSSPRPLTPPRGVISSVLVLLLHLTKLLTALTSPPLLFLLLTTFSLLLLTLLLRSLSTSLSPLLQLSLPSLEQLSLPSLHLSSFGAPLRMAIGPVVGVYCSTIGVGCGEVRKKRERELGGAARTVKLQAEQALDIFQSVLALRGADGVGLDLHHVELWELAVAVRHTSGMEEREFLGDQLQELGDLTREVRDAVTRLGSQSLASFTWILQEFTRLETLLSRPPSRPLSEPVLSSLLSSLLSKISSDLSSLLTALDSAIPLADRASSLGGRLSGALAAEHTRVQRVSEEVPVWRALVERQGWKGKQLRRDLELAGESVQSVKDLRWGLERARSSFIEFEANVGAFKAGVVGFHLAGHGLSAEEEVRALSGVMADFRSTLEIAKQSRRAGGGARALPAAM